MAWRMNSHVDARLAAAGGMEHGAESDDSASASTIVTAAPDLRPQSVGSSTAETAASLENVRFISSMLSSSAHAGRAEKAADNPDNPWLHAHQEHNATPTAVTQLFEAPPSPLSSRATSDVRISSVRRKNPEKLSLSGHLYAHGLLQGRHSDIAVHVFGKKYALHRIILERAPFFEAAFNGNWKESNASEITLYPEDTDPNISRTTFELALKRLYGCHDHKEEEPEAIGLLATASWLDLQDLVDDCVTYTLEKLGLSTIGVLIEHFVSHDYGLAGQKILGAAKASLCRVGMDLPMAIWDEIPSSLIREVVGSDCFFVHDEWHRFLLAKALLNRRLSKLAVEVGLVDAESSKIPKVPRNLRGNAFRPPTEASTEDKSSFEPSKILTFYSHPSIRPLLELMDYDIYYAHLEFEQLQRIRASKDVFGIPVLPEHIIKEALWLGIEFREKVVNAGGSNKLFWCSRRSECDEQLQYSIPQVDRNFVVGGNADPLSTNAIFRTRSNLAEKPQSRSGSLLTSKQVSEQSSASRKHHSHYPPFRFAAEFPNTHLRREGKRTYSRTVFYAGSYWNLYIQKVRKNGRQPQLGVYVHRTRESDEKQFGRSKTSVDQRISLLERELTMPRPQNSYATSSGHQGHASSSFDDDRTLASPGDLRSARLAAYLASSNAAGDGIGSDTKTPRMSVTAALASDDENTFLSDAEDHTGTIYGRPGFSRTVSGAGAYTQVIPPYVDGRQTVATFFKIFSPSRSGRMMSVYESAPDHFDFSQSWGWKSTTLTVNDLTTLPSDTEDISTTLDISNDSPGAEARGVSSMDADPDGALEQQADKIEGGLADGRLRFMVILGVV